MPATKTKTAKPAKKSLAPTLTALAEPWKCPHKGCDFTALTSQSRGVHLKKIHGIAGTSNGARCWKARASAKAKKAAPVPTTPPPSVDEPAADLVNHPPHYTSHPSGIECIQVTEHMSFNLGNAIKYLWRADEKGSPITDLEKARWYVEREIARRKAAVSAEGRS